MLGTHFDLGRITEALNEVSDLQSLEFFPGLSYRHIQLECILESWIQLRNRKPLIVVDIQGGFY